MRPNPNGKLHFVYISLQQIQEISACFIGMYHKGKLKTLNDQETHLFYALGIFQYLP